MCTQLTRTTLTFTSSLPDVILEEVIANIIIAFHPILYLMPLFSSGELTVFREANFCKLPALIQSDTSAPVSLVICPELRGKSGMLFGHKQ